MNRFRELVGVLGLVAVLGSLGTPPTAPSTIAETAAISTPLEVPVPVVHCREPRWVIPPPSVATVPSPAARDCPHSRSPAREAFQRSLNGISYGMTLDQVEAWLGPGRQEAGASGTILLRYATPPVTVWLAPSRWVRRAGHPPLEVYQVCGGKLRLDGRVVLRAGDSRRRVLQVLGESRSNREFTSPDGGDYDEQLGGWPISVYLRRGVVEMILLTGGC